ncbi:transporter substrate-binding domain-containing protein, partial [Vibrio cholerae]|uniref:transporter substrate-binding domain-containing protein n=1 Tax=Vibrio cholerae TaxID=666 RepID=UPI001124D17D
LNQSDDRVRGFEAGANDYLSKPFNKQELAARIVAHLTASIDTISNQITITDARKAKYLFSDPYVIDGAQITVRKGNEAIKGIDDLAGKT